MTDTSSAITALRSLAALYKAIVQAVKDEAIITEQVFPSPSAALVLFVTRLFEQRVQVRGWLPGMCVAKLHAAVPWKL